MGDAGWNAFNRAAEGEVLGEGATKDPRDLPKNDQGRTARPQLTMGDFVIEKKVKQGKKKAELKAQQAQEKKEHETEEKTTKAGLKKPKPKEEAGAKPSVASGTDWICPRCRKNFFPIYLGGVLADDLCSIVFYSIGFLLKICGPAHDLLIHALIFLLVHTFIYHNRLQVPCATRCRQTAVRPVVLRRNRRCCSTSFRRWERPRKNEFAGHVVVLIQWSRSVVFSDAGLRLWFYIDVNCGIW